MFPSHRGPARLQQGLEGLCSLCSQQRCNHPLSLQLSGASAVSFHTGKSPGSERASDCPWAKQILSGLTWVPSSNRGLTSQFKQMAEARQNSGVVEL